MNMHTTLALTALVLTAITAVTAATQQAYAQCVAGAPCLSSSYTAGGSANDAKAGDSAACDGDFMNQIYARAFLEAERENVTNRTYLKKPDSTLQYTCFGRFLNHVAQQAPQRFSESTRWAGARVPLNIAHSAAGNPTSITINVNMGSGHIVPNMTNVVSDAFEEYVSTNFDHPSLGGRGSNIVVGATTTPGAYSCDRMARIWQLAKCENLPSASDTFWTFREMVSGDSRQLTPACTNAVTAQMITTARNAAPGFRSATFDAMDLYLGHVGPAAATTDCSAPIQTGLQVRQVTISSGAPTTTNLSGVTQSVTTIPEAVCVNPGCYYHATSTSCRRG